MNLYKVTLYQEYNTDIQAYVVAADYGKAERIAMKYFDESTDVIVYYVDTVELIAADESQGTKQELLIMEETNEK